MSIPASDPNDSDDVVLALETAEALWNKGDPGEALRWLRRAAEAAGDSGNDSRAVVLAKAVADLNAAGSDAAPKQVRPPPLPPQAPAAKTDAQPEAQEVEESPLSAKGGLKGVSKAPPPPPSARKSQAPPKPSAPPSSARASRSDPAAPATQEAASRDAEPPPKKKMNPPPTPGSLSTAASTTRGERPPAAESNASESSLAESGATPSLTKPPTKSVKNRSGLSTHGKSSLTPGSKTGPTSTPAAPKSGKKRNFARAALRVYVTTKDQDGERLEVFVLNEGQRPPPGAVEALLVPLRRGAKLLR